MLFYCLQLFLSEVRLSMHFKHLHSFEHNFKGMTMPHQGVTLKAEPGGWGGNSAFLKKVQLPDNTAGSVESKTQPLGLLVPVLRACACLRNTPHTHSKQKRAREIKCEGDFSSFEMVGWSKKKKAGFNQDTWFSIRIIYLIKETHITNLVF